MTQPDTAASEEQDAKLIRNERAKLLAAYLIAAVVLHLAARRVLKGLRS